MYQHVGSPLGPITARKLPRLTPSLSHTQGVAAVVLRVDSPGGDALASDLMWAAIKRLRRFKPVVASFGDVSASGGGFRYQGPECDSMCSQRSRACAVERGIDWHDRPVCHEVEAAKPFKALLRSLKCQSSRAHSVPRGPVSASLCLEALLCAQNASRANDCQPLPQADTSQHPTPSRRRLLHGHGVQQDRGGGADDHGQHRRHQRQVQPEGPLREDRLQQDHPVSRTVCLLFRCCSLLAMQVFASSSTQVEA